MSTIFNRYNGILPHSTLIFATEFSPYLQMEHFQITFTIDALDSACTSTPQKYATIRVVIQFCYL